MKPERDLRIDVRELKVQIVKRIGTERSKRYFYYLDRLLSQKLSKSEFDKLCLRVLGRENLQLHNQFIRSILKNACHAKTPPPIHEAGPSKSLPAGGRSSSPIEDGHKPSGSMVPNQIQAPPIWSNGVVLPMSPRKGRSGIRDPKLRDRLSPLGPNGKVDSASHQSMAIEDGGNKVIMENGELPPCDYQRPSQHLHGLAEQPENDKETSVQQSMGRQKMKKSMDAPVLLHSKDQTKVAVAEDEEEVEQANHLNFSRSPLLAPLGIPFCSASVGGARKTVPMASSGNFVSYFDSGGLSDTETLKKRMEQIAVAQGLGGVSMDCANMLNNMLDVYLKRLVKSCVELAEARSAHEPRKHHLAQKQQIQTKLINGMCLTNHYHMQNGGGPADIVQEHRNRCSISLLDFSVAMELNPQQLGEDWPLLLEKISMHAFEE
ncbi:uncharacterized protein LOC131152106 [Malania oleifera]|uniref:uncharacterized protein LOC131152106 n=1 Tax=Malania oleifera TaxID=397392 RepID=UPI0025AE5CF2|nr:uncharacterized protein LOC131152106 [Malania oleifera]